MKLTPEIIQVLINSEAKALASFSNNDINVVPVSTVKIVDNDIWLIDYFFNKTKDNIKQNPKVALTFWMGLIGYQIKAKTSYLTNGDKFEKAVDWISKIHPYRLVKGLIILETYAIFDISINNKRL